MNCRTMESWKICNFVPKASEFMFEYLAYRKWAIDVTLFQHCFNIVALYVNYLGQYMNTELPYRPHK